MGKIDFDPVEEDEIPRRGKYREEVRQWISKLLKSKDKAIKSKEFKDRELAMSYYDSFKDHIKKQKLSVDVKIRQTTKNPTPAWTLFLIKKEA